jgi:hypothetical protein
MCVERNSRLPIAYRRKQEEPAISYTMSVNQHSSPRMNAGHPAAVSVIEQSIGVQGKRGNSAEEKETTAG